MSRLYVFADESGDFNFAIGPNISRYFIVCTVTCADCSIGDRLVELRRQLAWEQLRLGDFFHATTDLQVVRDRVFDLLQKHDFTIQATIMEKRKAQPQVRPTKHRFYQHGWFYHFKYGMKKHIHQHSEFLITAASVGTKKGQKVFTDAVNDVVQQTLNRRQWRTSFLQSSADPLLQVVDYCTWAIRRKWESDHKDLRSYDLIKDRITYEYDLWKSGNTYHY